MGLRDDILGSDDLAFRDVVVPEWKGRTVRVLEMDGETRILYEDGAASAKEASGGKDENPLRLACRLLVYTLRDPATGAPLFGMGDVEQLAKRSPRVVMRLFGVAAGVSMIGEKAVEKEAGKSEAAPSGSSPTT